MAINPEITSHGSRRAKLLAVPNFSEGRSPDLIAALRSALDRPGTDVLDRHSDREHNRTVFTVAGDGRELTDALIGAAEIAIARIDMRRHIGLHPAIGSLDVCPVVWLDALGEVPARERALSVASQLGTMGIPVFLYGDLATSEERFERAYFRKGGFKVMLERMGRGELVPDRGPSRPHQSAGAVLVTARPPLAAFNIAIDLDDHAAAQTIAAELREAGGGMPGVRALGLPLGSGGTQISTNIHDPVRTPLAAVVERVRELAAPYGARVVAAEIVGLVPEAALENFPRDVPVEGFNPDRQLIELRIGIPRPEPEPDSVEEQAQQPADPTR